MMKLFNRIKEWMFPSPEIGSVWIWGTKRTDPGKNKSWLIEIIDYYPGTRIVRYSGYLGNKGAMSLDTLRIYYCKLRNYHD